MYFEGKLWGRFRTFAGWHKDGRPAICCWPVDEHASDPWFCITVERWLAERRSGGIMASS